MKATGQLNPLNVSEAFLIASSSIQCTIDIKSLNFRAFLLIYCDYLIEIMPAYKIADQFGCHLPRI